MRLGLAAVVSILCSNQHVWAEEICGVQAPDLAGLRVKVQGLPGAAGAASRSPDFDVLNVGSGQLWNFTKPSHPAHPSVACRMISEVNGQLFVETKVVCKASKDRCDSLAADYARLDQQMTEALKNAAKR